LLTPSKIKRKQAASRPPVSFEEAHFSRHFHRSYFAREWQVCGIQAIAWAARNGRIPPDRGLLVSENINNN